MTHPFQAEVAATAQPNIARTVIQALDHIARLGSGHAFIYHGSSHQIALRYPCKTGSGTIITRVFRTTVREALNQIVAAGVPVFDMRPMDAVQREAFTHVPLVCCPPHKPSAPPYGSGDFAPIEVVAERARMLGAVVINVP